MSAPIPRIPADKYAPKAAKVRFRVKGSGSEGNVYEGQKLVIPCTNCGKHLAKPS